MVVAAATFTDADRLVTAGPVVNAGDPITGFGTPVEVALTGATISILVDRAAGAAFVPSLGVSSPLYIPAAICACVWAWTRAWAIVQFRMDNVDSSKNKK